MEQSRDSVRLFGKTIQFVVAGRDGGWNQRSQNLPDRELAEQEKEQDSAGSGESSSSSSSSKPSVETGDRTWAVPEGQGAPPTVRTPQSEREKNEEDTRHKAPKKPQKILPCPRCSSKDTKFCYFNNYNVNQPRYFCRNCQRYWTAGGSMRNVPVGAGRRKNKSSAAAHHRLTATQSTAAGTLPYAIADGTTGAVLSFGSDAAVLIGAKRIGDDNEHSNGSSVTAVTHSAGEEGGTQKFQEQPIGAPWICQWNSSPPSGHLIPLCPATTARWGFAAQGAWSVPWQLPPPLGRAQTDPSPAPAVPSSSPLGKHPRYGYTLNHSARTNGDVEDKLPRLSKTMRIDDPSDAANSSAWLTMGVENSKGREFVGGGPFKAFEAEGEASSGLLHRNPAALSRSLSFWESA